MSNSQFVGTIFNGGLKSTHYFNGRLLTADALSDDQQAVQTQLLWLGKASGYGIIEGLLVSKTPNDTTQLSITQGIGVNHDGQVVYLPNDITLAPIVKQAAQEATTPKLSEEEGQFTPRIALQQQAQTVMLTTPGVYLLTVEPTSHYEGQVAMKAAANGINSSIGSTTPGIGNRWEVEGVRFKIIRLDDENLPNLYASADLADFTVDSDKRQNMLAHWCYGTLALKGIGRSPFLFQTDYSPLETLAGFRTLSELDLDSSDLPLAVFHWDGGALTFVDTWSVRRRIVLPDALSGAQRYPLWKALVSDEHRAENQARFLQFQDQLDVLIQQGRDNPKVDLAKAQATDYFGFLPPVGFLPVTYDSLHKIVCSKQYEKQSPPDTTGTGQTGQTGRTGGMFNFRSLLSAIGNLGPLVSFFNPAAEGALLLTRAAADPQSLQNLQVMGETLGILTSSQTGQTATELTSATGLASGATAAQMLVSTVEGQQVQIPVQMMSPTQQSEVSQEQPKSRGFRPLHEIVQQQVCALLSENSQRDPAGCFNLSQFFHNLTLHLYLIGNDSIDFILHQSWNEEAIDLIHAPSPDDIVALNRDATLAQLPFVIDIYLVEENLRDATAPLYVMFHKAHHSGELIEGYNLPNVTRLL